MIRARVRGPIQGRGARLGAASHGLRPEMFRMGCEERDLGLSDGKEPGKDKASMKTGECKVKRGRLIRMQGKKRVQPASLRA